MGASASIPSTEANSVWDEALSGKITVSFPVPWTAHESVSSCQKHHFLTCHVSLWRPHRGVTLWSFVLICFPSVQDAPAQPRDDVIGQVI
jgi:hypothetical protein